MSHITEREDALFAEWKKANPSALFRDGVLRPTVTSPTKFESYSFSGKPIFATTRPARPYKSHTICAMSSRNKTHRTCVCRIFFGSRRLRHGALESLNQQTSNERKRYPRTVPRAWNILRASASFNSRRHLATQPSCQRNSPTQFWKRTAGAF